VVEFKLGFEFSDLQRFAELAFEDRFDADSVARFDEHGDGLYRQQGADAAEFLRQADLVLSADLDDVAE
jgi:hypothetical protein